MNTWFLPRLGGIERRVYRLSRHLAARGHEVTVVAARVGDLPKEETIDGFRVVRHPARVVPTGTNPPFLLCRGVAEAVASASPDVVDLHERWSPAAVRGAHAAKAPVVTTWHNAFGEGSGLLRGPSLVNDAWNRRYARRSRAVVAISDAVRRELAARRFGPTPILTVPNGSVRPAPGDRDEEPDDGRPLPRGPYAIAVGRLTREKGVDDALRALAAARTTAPQLRLVVAGWGPLRRPLERLARRLDLEDAVEFPGWLPEATKFRFLEHAVALLHMARFESFGLAVGEALVAGTPVVATDVGGVREVVGDAGLLVPQGDAEGAGAALASLWRDPDARAALSKSASGRRGALDWEVCAARMEAVYEDALR